MSLTKTDSSETLHGTEKVDKVGQQDAPPDAHQGASPLEEPLEEAEVTKTDSPRVEETVVIVEVPEKVEDGKEEVLENVNVEETLALEEPEKTQNNTSKLVEEEAADELVEIAKKLYNEEFVLIRPEEYTQFLAADDKDSAAIRELYMDMFTWSPSLVKSTRILCLKLYLKGESQEIDRILLAFTKLYIRQNPVNVFCTRDFEKIYIILYSLILLNTALHNLEISKKSSISQADYVRNTFTTFLQLNKKTSSKLSVKQKIQIERELHSYYDDLARSELYLKKTSDSTLHTSSQRRVISTNSNRLSVAETIRLTVSGNSNDHPALPQVNGEDFDLSRQISNTSNLSTDHDGQRRHSLALLKVRSGGSAVSHVTATSNNAGYGLNGARVGFTRVLHSNTNSQRNTLKNRSSLDHLRHYGHSLGHKSSRASIVSRQSNAPEDQLSLLTTDLPNLDTLYNGKQDLEDFDVANFQDSYDLKLELQGSPYLKEGLLKLRIINNDQLDSTGNGDVHTPASSGILLSASSITSRKPGGFFSFFKSAPKEPASVSTTVGTSHNHHAFSTKFSEYFVVVSKGELRLYSFDPKQIKKQQQKLKKLRKHSLAFGVDLEDDEDDIGDGNWLKNAANMGNYNLCSTIAQLERLSLSQLSDKIQWSLSFPKTSKKAPKKFVFEAGTMEVATEYVNTCNFWASKITAVPPLEESVSSLEYGWTHLDGLVSMGDAFKKARNISKWEQLPKGVYISNLSVADEGDEVQHEGLLKQFLMTLKYYNSLKGYYNNFSQMRTTFLRNMRKFTGTSNYKLVSQNYETRANEYKVELTKYKNYVIMLGYGLKLRFDAVEDDVYEKLKQDIIDDTELTIDKENDVEVGAEVAKRLTEHHESELEVIKVAKKELEKLSMLTPDLYMMFRRKDALPESRDEKEDAEYDVSTGLEDTSGTLVKLPKNFSLADIKDLESSPINQLLTADVKSSGPGEGELNQAKRELIMSFSTNTIKEEDEEFDNVI